MYVCVCHAIRESELVEAVQEGTVTFQAVRRSLGCGRSCGHCKRHVNVVIEATLQAGIAGTARGARLAEAAIDTAIQAELMADLVAVGEAGVGLAADIPAGSEAVGGDVIDSAALCGQRCVACPHAPLAPAVPGTGQPISQPIIIPRWRSAASGSE